MFALPATSYVKEKGEETKPDVIYERRVDRCLWKFLGFELFSSSSLFLCNCIKMLTAPSSSEYTSIYDYIVLVRTLSGKMVSIKHREEKNNKKKTSLLMSSHVYLNQISLSVKKNNCQTQCLLSINHLSGTTDIKKLLINRSGGMLFTLEYPL